MLLADNTQSNLLPDKSSEGRRLHYYDKGETIPLAPQGVWQVYRGISQLSQINDKGEETLLGWAIPSTFFGLWLTQIEFYQAKALTEIYLKWYNISEIENSSAITSLMLNQIVRRLRQTEALVSIAGLKRVEDRLTQLLNLLKTEIGEQGEDCVRLGARLTHQNLANSIGTTRVTVTRLLGDFQRQGLVTLDSERHLVIHF